MEYSHSQLINEISAPIKSVRIFAIEKCFQLKPSEELINLLNIRLKQEEDEECLILIKHCIEYLTTKYNTADALQYNLIDENLLQNFLKLSLCEKLNFIKNYKTKLSENLEFVFKILESESNPIIIAELIKSFSYQFSKEQLNYLIKLFQKNSFLSVRLAVLETLANICPESIVKEIPKLLVSEDPKLRLLAIKVLSNYDISTALNYIEDYLFHKDINLRKLALQSIILLPFEQIDKLILKYIYFESDLIQLQLAIDIILTNPQPNIIYDLFELVENTIEKQKKELLRKSCLELVEIIKRSNILEDKFDEFYQSINIWITRRKAYKYINFYYKKFLEDPENFDSNEFYRDLANIKEIKTIVAEIINDWPYWYLNEKFVNILKLFIDNSDQNNQNFSKINNIKNEQFKNADLNKIIGISQSTFSNDKENLVQYDKKIFSEENWNKLNINQKIRNISLLKNEEIINNRLFLEKILYSDNESKEVIAAILKSFKKTEISDYKELAYKFLNSNSTQLVAAAIEYLEKFDIDTLSIHIGRFLNSDSPILCLLAIRILIKIDKVQALSAFKAMLNSKIALEQSAAISCAIYFDFNVIRESLFSFLLMNPDNKLFEGVVFLFQSNPDLENLYYLYRLEKKLYMDISKVELLKKVRMNIYKILCDSLVLINKSWEKVEEELEERYKKDTELEKAKKQLYNEAVQQNKTYQKYFEITKELKNLNWVDYWNKTKYLFASITIFVVLVSLYFIYYSKNEDEPQKMKFGALPAVPVYVKGTLTKLDKERKICYFVDEQNKKYSLSFNSVDFLFLDERRVYNIKILPLRVDEYNIIHGVLLDKE